MRKWLVGKEAHSFVSLRVSIEISWLVRKLKISSNFPRSPISFNCLLDFRMSFSFKNVREVRVRFGVLWFEQDSQIYPLVWTASKNVKLVPWQNSHIQGIHQSLISALLTQSLKERRNHHMIVRRIIGRQWERVRYMSWTLNITRLSSVLTSDTA